MLNMTKDEIIEHYKDRHGELTRKYYADKENYPGGKAAFDLAHSQIWADMDAALIEAGYMEPPANPSPGIEERLNDIEARIAALEGL